MMTSLPSLRSIDTFVCVTETGSYRAASQRLNVTASAISHRIHALEQDLGVELFDRTGRGLTLSGAGRVYLEQLRPGLETLRKATMSLRSPNQRPVLRIACIPVFSAAWLVPRIDRFLTANQDVRIELLAHGTRKAARADIVIGTSKNIEGEPVKLFDVEVLPICTPAYARRNGLREPSDLLRTTIIDLAGTDEYWPAWLGAAGLSVNDVENMMTVDSPMLALQLAMTGAGVAMGSAALLSEQIARGALVTPFMLTSGRVYPIHASSRSGWVEPLAGRFRRWLECEIAVNDENPSPMADEF